MTMAMPKVTMTTMTMTNISKRRGNEKRRRTMMTTTRTDTTHCAPAALVAEEAAKRTGSYTPGRSRARQSRVLSWQAVF
jgi:hypothetical protein